MGTTQIHFHAQQQQSITMGFSGGAEILSGVTQKIVKYSTPFGYGWVIVLFIFRLLPIETIGEQIYDGYATENDAADFECTSTQPACRQQCFNRFHPISHSRLWELQILVVAVPILIFSAVALGVQEKNEKLKQKLAKIEETEVELTSNPAYRRTREKLSDYHVVQKMNYVDGTQEEVIWHPVVRNVYIGTTVVKILLEIFFVHNIYVLQRIQNNAEHPVDEQYRDIAPLSFSQVWLIPDRYYCRLGLEAHSACSQDTNLPCFVPRSYEKTTFLYYTISMQLLSILLLFLDLFYILRKSFTVPDYVRNKERLMNNSMKSIRIHKD